MQDWLVPVLEILAAAFLIMILISRAKRGLYPVFGLLSLLFGVTSGAMVFVLAIFLQVWSSRTSGGIQDTAPVFLKAALAGGAALTCFIIINIVLVLGWRACHRKIPRKPSTSIDHR